MGLKRLSKGKPFASPPNKRKSTHVDTPDKIPEKPSSTAKASSPRRSASPVATAAPAPAVKRKLIDEEKEPDDMNNAVGALGSSASPSSGSGEGTTAQGTSPPSVSTAAPAVVVAPPTKKVCTRNTVDAAKPVDADSIETQAISLDAESTMPSTTAQPTAAAAPFPAALLPFLPFARIPNAVQGGMLPFPFAALQIPPQTQQQQASNAVLPLPPAPQPTTSPILELTPVQKAVLDYAASTNQDPSTLWTVARQIALKYTAQQLLKALAAPIEFVSPHSSLPLPAAATTAKVTAGVSYVVRTESKQIEVSDQEILPHMVYRPPTPMPGSELSETDPEVAAALEILLKEPTLAVSMPLRDENAMKTYLLEHAERAALVDAAEGSIMELEGAGNAAPLCQDKNFICLHYKLLLENGGISGENSNHMKLVPCLPSASSDPTKQGDAAETTTTESDSDNNSKTTISSSLAASSLASSNVQLGIMIRKGVGGTYPLRSAARKLHAQGLLGALMDESLPTTVTTQGSDISNGQDNTTAQENGGNESPEAADGPAPAHQRLSLYTLSCRLELYLDEETWGKLDVHSRNVLQSTVYHLEHRLRAHFEKRNWEMLKSSVCEKLETLVAAPTAARNDKDNEYKESEDFLDSEFAAKLLPLFSIALQKQDDASALAAATTEAAGNNLLMDFSLALVLSASCLSTENHALHHMPWPLYCINTRDCFTHHLVPICTTMHAPGGRAFTKTEWFFRAGELPTDYQAVLQRCALTKTGESTGNARKCDFAATEHSSEIAGVLKKMVDTLAAKEEEGEESLNATTVPKQKPLPLSSNTLSSNTSSARNTPFGVLYPVGVTTYNEVFTPAQLSDIELRCDSIDTSAREGRLPTTCSHSTLNKGGGLKRTKFFFGARYLWTREQLAAPDAHVAKGVRVDVPPAPKWVHAVVETPLVAATVLPEGHINSVALNMYHDGSEGIQVHFDDSARFQQPIFSLRLFSDSRLSFGTQLYGYTNGSFFIPMPRGCVTVMEAGSYAANGVKHCVRPVDMAGKSAGMILRRMNPNALAEAREHFMEESIDWMRGLSLNASLRAESILGQGLAELAYRNSHPHYNNHRGGAGARGVPGSKTMRQVANVMEYMLRSVEYTDWKDRTCEATVASVMTRMVHRVELAETAQVKLVYQDDNDVFGVVDSMVSCCEILSAPPQTPEMVNNRKRKFWPPRPYSSPCDGGGSGGSGKASRGPYRKRPRGIDFNHFSGGNSGSESMLPDAVVIAMVINKMVGAIEATEQKNEMLAVAQVMRRMIGCIEAQNL